MQGAERRRELRLVHAHALFFAQASPCIAVLALLFASPMDELLDLAGVSREDSYRLVQRNAMKVWESDQNYKTLLLGSKEIMKILSEKELDELFDPKRSLKHVDYIFEQVGIH